MKVKVTNSKVKVSSQHIKVNVKGQCQRSCQGRGAVINVNYVPIYLGECWLQQRFSSNHVFIFAGSPQRYDATPADCKRDLLDIAS